jgi:sarcosine oxidase
MSQPRLSHRRTICRRSLLRVAAGLSVTARVATANQMRSHVAVVGAGAFGCWTALHLQRMGSRVTLLDAWGPGHSRASSGGETRVIRATYGPDRIYVEMVIRALTLWREHEKRWKQKLYRQTGVLWMASEDDKYEKDSLPLLRDARLPFETLNAQECSKRFTQVNFDGVRWAILEKEAGYLFARRSCALVVEAFAAAGGDYRQLAVQPGEIRGKAMQPLRLSDGAKLAADHYVFACGPWLGKLFPDLLANRIKPTRQEVFFFGTPPGDSRFLEDRLPIWIDNGPRQFYGIPGNERRGFKLADDTQGSAIDPTTAERTITPAALKAARDYLAFRFPALKDAPLVESRVCQYENSPDGRYILDRHPLADNVWLAGGGSGHGFKMGPAIGERLAEMVLGKRPVEPFFSLSRFK